MHWSDFVRLTDSYYSGPDSVDIQLYGALVLYRVCGPLVDGIDALRRRLVCKEWKSHLRWLFMILCGCPVLVADGLRACCEDQAWWMMEHHKTWLRRFPGIIPPTCSEFVIQASRRAVSRLFLGTDNLPMETYNNQPHIYNFMAGGTLYTTMVLAYRDLIRRNYYFFTNAVKIPELQHTRMIAALQDFIIDPYLVINNHPSNHMRLIITDELLDAQRAIALQEGPVPRYQTGNNWFSAF